MWAAEGERAILTAWDVLEQSTSSSDDNHAGEVPDGWELQSA